LYRKAFYSRRATAFAQYSAKRTCLCFAASRASCQARWCIDVDQPCFRHHDHHTRTFRCPSDTRRVSEGYFSRQSNTSANLQRNGAESRDDDCRCNGRRDVEVVHLLQDSVGDGLVFNFLETRSVDVPNATLRDVSQAKHAAEVKSAPKEERESDGGTRRR